MTSLKSPGNNVLSNLSKDPENPPSALLTAYVNQAL